VPLFTVSARDKPDSFDLRARTRAAHLAWLRSQGPLVLLGGPWTDEGGRPVGSLLIIEAPDLAAAQTFVAYDPYAQAGLFAQVEVRPWKLVVGGFGPKSGAERVAGA
jgi:uncharacterized protein